MKEKLKTAGAALSFVALYFIIVFLDWILTGPLNLFQHQEQCEYKVIGKAKCATKEEYCRYETRKMCYDSNDTLGSNTNSQDTMSRTMLEIYNKCVERE